MGITYQQPREGGAGSVPALLTLSARSTVGSVGSTGAVDGSTGSTGAAGDVDDSAGSAGAARIEGDTDLDGAANEFVVDSAVASPSVPQVR